MKTTQWLTAIATTAAGLCVMARLSALPIAYHSSDSAGLRLSWSARPERIEVCREVSAEEQAKLAEHMRQRVVCDGVFASYTLRVEVDGRVIGESVVRGAGFRNDRPLYLLRNFAVPAGEHRVVVMLTRREQQSSDSAVMITATIPLADTGLFAGRAQRETAERQRRTSAAIPPQLTLDTVVTFIPRRVEVVAYDSERHKLQLRAPATKP